MIGFDDAQALLAASIRPLGTERVNLIEAHRRVLADPVYAAIASPRGAVSAMDGFALRDADAAVGSRFAIVGESFAGGPPPPAITSGQCLRIFTGATLPAGADRVVMQENCTADGKQMTITEPFGPGWHVRAVASDFAERDLLLPAGTLLDARAMVILASADSASAMVYRQPKVAIIATGDELAAPGTAASQPDKIPESVSFGAAAMAQEYGAQIVARFTSGDDLPGLRLLADRALSMADVVVVTGGASVGERDYAKAMFADQALDLLFSKVAIKPGKPIWIGQAQGRWVIGLPGNPTSAMVTARLFLTPLLASLQGQRAEGIVNWIRLPVAGQCPRSEGRTSFVRARLTKDGLVPLSNQDSGAQAPLCDAQWLLKIDSGVATQPQVGGKSTELALNF